MLGWSPRATARISERWRFRPQLLPFEDRTVPAGLDYYQPPAEWWWNPDGGSLSAPQVGDAFDVAVDFLRRNADQLGLAPGDFREPILTGRYTDTLTGTTQLYLTQSFQSLPIVNAVLNVSLTSANEVIAVGSRFASGLVQTPVLVHGPIAPVLDAPTALSLAVGPLGLPVETSPGLLSSNPNGTSLILLAPELSLDDIPADLVYVATETGVTLAWNYVLRTPDGEHWYNLHVDAVTGKALSAADWGHGHLGEYRVYPLPAENPLDGPRTLVVHPADPTASPFGWHDTDGVAGPEFTTTQGNNVKAQEDEDGDNGDGFQPDAGAGLVFDFPIDLSEEPSEYLSASLTNLFYVSNIAHDVFFKFGFTESAGNFQATNYSGSGFGNDAVLADGQDGSSKNNANFATPPDGQAPRMQMFLWDVTAGNSVISNTPGVSSPSTASGASFGPPSFSVTADAVLADPILAGSPLVNDVAGKIVIVDRGGDINFTVKVKNAQNAGAVGVIVLNNETNPAVITMGGTDESITIPSVMISLADGNALKAAIANGTVNLTIIGTAGVQRDGSLDAGIIIHEYGHGVTNRLTGGPADANALQNRQSGGMGEGWSDFFALMFTQIASDTATTPRTIAAYASGKAEGIRRFPYSTDMAVNPLTFQAYNNDSAKQVHNTGEIWASALWDLNWLLINKYGYDADLSTGYTGSGVGAAGNKLALQLVMDGLKRQVANPSFTQARDAILLADQILTGGANQTEIWTAFAGRGLGFGAFTASSSSGTVTTSTVVPSDLARVTNTTTAAPVDGQITVKFNREMDPTSFNLATGIVSFTGPGNTDRLSAITGFSWSADNRSLRLELNGSAPVGAYTLVLAPTLEDSLDRPLDQDVDAIGGEVPDDQAVIAVTLFNPLVVTTTADELDSTYNPADLSLREAIALANLHPGDDSISFAPGLAGQSITLSLGELVVSDPDGLTAITGPSTPVTLNGANANRVLVVTSDAVVSLENLTLTRGRGAVGANLTNLGTMSLTNVTISLGNSPDDVAGGIYNAGTATLTQVTISGNLGGGIVNDGTMTLLNATISGNTAAFSGGGIANGGTLTATHVTITANRSDDGNSGTAEGGGIYTYGSSSIDLRNSIVAGNFRGTGNTIPDDIDGDFDLNTANSFSNVIGTGGSGGLVDGVNGNRVGVNARLGPLQANGGVTATHLPFPDSPAVDAADSNFAPATDQRGTSRPIGPGPDIGATEARFELTGFTDQTIDEDGVLNLPFSIADYPASSVFSFISSNGTLATSAGISVLGTGSNRTLRVTPIANAFGLVTITVGIGIGGPTLEQAAFQLTVNPVNDAPLLTGLGTLQGIPANTFDPPGATLAVVFASSGYTDLDPGGSLVGFAIVGNPANPTTQGTWEYSSDDGTNWFAISPVADTSSALVLSLTTRVRFRPVPGFTGTVSSLVVRAIDNSYLGAFSSTTGGVESRITLGSSLRGTPSSVASGTNTISTFVGEPTVSPPPASPPPPVSPPRTVSPPPPLTPTPTGFATGSGSNGNGSATMFRANGSAAFTVTPFPATPTIAVRVASADVTADGSRDLIATTGAGVSVRVLVFDGASQRLDRELNPFEASFTGGAFVAAGDLDGDGFADIAVSPDESGGPRVVVFSGRTGERLADFFGIDDPNFRGGVRTAFGDINGDGIPDLIVAAGFGGGPRVAIWDGRSFLNGSGPQRLVNDFFLFEESLRNGAYIAAGDINGDGFADLIGGGGPSGGPRVFVVDGQRLLDSGGSELTPLANFFAGDPNNRDGVRVAAANLDGDRFADLVVAAAGTDGPAVFGYAGTGLKPGAIPDPSFGPDRFPELLGGVFVG